MSTSTDEPRRLVETWEVELGEITTARFVSLVAERSYDHFANWWWATERMTLEGVFAHAAATYRDRHERKALLDLSAELGTDCLGHVWLDRGQLYVRLAARDVDTLAAARAWLRERYPLAEAKAGQRVPVTFWSLSRYARRTSRTIDVPSWDEIAGNYPAAVRAQLERLMRGELVPERRGQLVLWHGQPGTGKTYALRALAWEWRSWCRFHYVTDPEVLFGEKSSYMLDVLLDDEDDDDASDGWRLLVLEDTGELLASDAKERTGQGLSRLLNVVDGLIGQGLKVLVLATTNEPLQRMHPAVSRPGRCLAEVEFVPFPADEASEWLARHEAAAAERGGTLAALFARAEGIELPERQPVGFSR